MSRASYLSSWSEKHEQVVEQCLESEEAFRAYLTSETSNVCRAYKAFVRLVRIFSDSIDEREKLVEKVKELGTCQEPDRGRTHICGRSTEYPPSCSDCFRSCGSNTFYCSHTSDPISGVTHFCFRPCGRSRSCSGGHTVRYHALGNPRDPE